MSDSRKPGEEHTSVPMLGWGCGCPTCVVSRTGTSAAASSAEAVAEPSHGPQCDGKHHRVASCNFKLAEPSRKQLEWPTDDYKVLVCPWCPGAPRVSNCPHDPFALRRRVQALEQEIKARDQRAAKDDAAFDIIDKLAREQGERAETAEQRIKELEAKLATANAQVDAADEIAETNAEVLLARIRELEAERDEARATKDMHKERQEQAEQQATALREALQDIVEDSRGDGPINAGLNSIQAAEALLAEANPAQEKNDPYMELIYAVGMKWPGETRHQTALRYIRQAESGIMVKPAPRGRSPVAEPKPLKELLKEWLDSETHNRDVCIGEEMAERLRAIDALHATKLSGTLLNKRFCGACGDVEPCATRKALDGER